MRDFPKYVLSSLIFFSICVCVKLLTQNWAFFTSLFTGPLNSVPSALIFLKLMENLLTFKPNPDKQQLLSGLVNVEEYLRVEYL